MDDVGESGCLSRYCVCRRLCFLALSWNRKIFGLDRSTFNPLRPLPDFLHPFTCSALFAVSQLFLQAKQDLFNLLAPGSHIYTYMAESVVGPK